MKLTNNVLLQSVDVLNELVQVKMPIKISFKLMNIIEEINQKIKTYNETRNILVQQYIKKDENGQPINATDEDGNILENKFIIDGDIDEFQKGLFELLDAEVDINVELINLDEVESIEIEPQQLLIIKWLFQ